MKILGIAFVVLGGLLAVLGFASYSSDIQLIVAFVGIIMAGIGAMLIYLVGIKNDLFSLYQWVKKEKA
jgi:ABC-type sulfate transport system permease subunit